MSLLRIIEENRPHKDDVHETFLPADHDLRLAVDQLEIGRLYLFDYAAKQGSRIRYVVQRTADGVAHTMLASCRACYHAERPHYISKGQVMCGRCNNPMHQPDEPGLTLMQKQCTLIAIPHSLENGQLVVSAKDVLSQAQAMEAQ